MTPARHVGTVLHLCNTESIGYVALKAISVSPTASVVGVTSRGIFLHTPSKQIFFISFESHRGPLTLNTTHTLTHVGQTVQIIDSYLFIGDAAIRLDTAYLWQPDPAPSNIVPLPTRIATLQHFLNRAATLRPTSNAQNPKSKNPKIPTRLPQSPFRNPQSENLQSPISNLQSLISNLGLGPGLTPSGDDVVIGFLLTLNRYGHYAHNDLFIQESKRRTTTLSACLIECAAQGLADERLIRVVDCIFSGKRNDRALDEMLGWGESSGFNALKGMALAMKNFESRNEQVVSLSNPPVNFLPNPKLHSAVIASAFEPSHTPEPSNLAD
ncbi:MAG: DUF2877 domain-containing protein [Chloroflexi bacterium]|nr:DUF2877 domain-containing protein [Chloroflexota bacterium]